MIVKSVRQTLDGKIHVTLQNKLGVTFNDAAAVRQAAQDAIRRLGIEGRVAIALLKSMRDADIEGQDLTNLLGLTR